MYAPIRDESRHIEIRIPWDKNTACGFFGALLLTLMLFLLFPGLEKEKPGINIIGMKTIPIEYIVFGDGDGAGKDGGNLSKSGEQYRGSKPMSELEDAKILEQNKYSKDASEKDPDLASNYTTKQQQYSSETKDYSPNGSSTKNVGSPDGSPYGTGMGKSGDGSGAGLGYGLEWNGGGGNRIVLNKPLPKYPEGVTTSAQIRIKFTVDKDGNVIKMMPLQKGEPQLEKAAMDALKFWRFNPIKDDKQMFGIITFTFRTS